MELVGLYVCTLYSIIHGPVSPWQRVGIRQYFRTEESLRYRADLEEEARQKEEQRRGKDWKWPALLCKFSDGRFDQFVVYGGQCCCAHTSSVRHVQSMYTRMLHAHLSNTSPKTHGVQVTTDWNMYQKLQPEPFGIEFYKVLSQWI